MKRNLLLSLSGLSLIALTFSSCKKEKPDTETQSAVDNNICETEFTKIMPEVNGIAIKENGVRSLQTACYTITIDSTTYAGGWPRILTIDYGTGCTDLIDGKTRKGKVICKFYSRWNTTPSKVKITLQNYYVNNVNYTADSVTISHDAATTFTNTIYNGKCIGSTWSLEWSATRTTSQIGGTNTPFDATDDIFQVDGNAKGKNRNGLAYTITITSSLVKRSSCSWIESGKMDLTPDGMATRTVDFGLGTCDNQATLTINGNTYTFTMN